MTIEKLMREYYEKLKNVESLLAQNKEALAKDRNDVSLRIEKERYNTMEQCYLQIINDLEDL